MSNSSTIRLTLTIDKELLGWIDHKIKHSIYRNRSNAIDSLLRKLQREHHEKQNHHYVG